MNNKNSIKRRNFIRNAALGLGAGSMACSSAQARKPALLPRSVKRDFIKVGMVGLGPYSHAMAYTRPINNPAVPPRTNMKVIAVWGREDKYRGSFRGTNEFVNKRVEELAILQSIDTFTKELGVEHVVKNPEDMVKLVDAVFIMDPENSLELARPFLEKGMPIFINRPIAWTLSDAREILRLAKENNCPIITGSCVPWMNEFQAAKSLIDKNTIQHYYADGSTANFCSYMPHILETIQMLVGGKVVRCSTHGMSWSADEDPLEIPPVMTHLEYAKTSIDRDPIVGVASTFYGNPYRNWVKVHCDKDVIEQGVFREGDYEDVLDEHLWLPLLRMVDRTFESGISPEDSGYILNKVETMLMAHKSGVEGGLPVGLDEISQHSLPRYETEKA